MHRAILIAEHETKMREEIIAAFRDRGFHPEWCEDGRQALSRIRDSVFDGILCERHLPGTDGLEILQDAKSSYPDLVFILMTGSTSTQDAVRAIKAGADDYVLKPLRLNEIVMEFEKALAGKGLREETVSSRKPVEERFHLEELIGQSRSMQEIFRLVEKIAPTVSTVLITGETGTGKELIARAIHSTSLRRDDPFLSLNCGALPETLLEDELFGHVKGAYTGASHDRAGYFESANGGTLFLDEISSLPLETQTKLLRVLQEREIRRMGSSEAIGVDVRIIAATNTDLSRLVIKGEFRDDLFYRLNVIPVRTPPLRQRKEDIPLLVNHFLARLARQKALPMKSPSQAALRRLIGFDWPGNVRQLENAIEMACVLTGDRNVLQPEDFQSVFETRVLDLQNLPDLEIPKEGIDLKGVLERLERNLIEKTLIRTNGNKNRAAHLLALKRTTLVEKLKKWQRKSPTQ